jgi:hypothetical protein
MKPGIFPLDPTDFNNMFIDKFGFVQDEKKNVIMRRILTLVSYYIPSKNS